MKWNFHNIVEFLQVYQQYPMLWDIKDKDYCNTKLKDEIFQNLFCELNEKRLVDGMDEKQLKARIKSIKDVYRQELSKIRKSKKNGYGTEEVYTPKLAWFNQANYLARSTKSYLDQSENSQEVIPEETSESYRGCAEFDSDNCPEKRFKNKLPAKIRTPTKRMKKRTASEKSPSEVSEAIQQLDKTAQNAMQEKPYDQFGKYVASELRQLPQREAILLQQEIQNCITRSKLYCLEHLHSQQMVDVAYSPSSHSVSSNDDEDVLRQVMINKLEQSMT